MQEIQPKKTSNILFLILLKHNHIKHKISHLCF